MRICSAVEGRAGAFVPEEKAALGLPWQGHEPEKKGAEISALFPVAAAAGPGTTLTHRRLPPGSGSAMASSAKIAEDTRSVASPTSTACSGAPTAPGRQTRPHGRYRPAGPAGRGPVPAALRRTQPDRRRPTPLLCTQFCGPHPPAHRPTRRLSRRPDQRVVADFVPLGRGSGTLGRTGSRLPLPAGIRARRSAAIPVPRDARGHVRRRLPARCARPVWRTIAVTMCPGKSGHK